MSKGKVQLRLISHHPSGTQWLTQTFPPSCSSHQYLPSFAPWAAGSEDVSPHPCACKGERSEPQAWLQVLPLSKTRQVAQTLFSLNYFPPSVSSFLNGLHTLNTINLLHGSNYATLLKEITIYFHWETPTVVFAGSSGQRRNWEVDYMFLEG